MNSLMGWDIEILRWVQTNRIEAFDSFFYWISFTTTFISIAILLVLGIIVFTKKEIDIKPKFKALLIIFLGSGLVSLILKYAFARPRPFLKYPDIVKLSEGGSYSFPSGHTTEAFAMALGMIWLFPKRAYCLPALCWAFLVAYSRIVLGVHYPTDILFAIGVAATITFSIKKLYKNERIK